MDAVVARPERRVSVSLRLPRQLVEVVTTYATKEGVSKTDAYVHFLSKGMGEASPGVADVDERLRELERRVGEIHAAVVPEADGSTFDQVKDAIVATASDYPAIERAYVFGSFARGSQSPTSDIDIRLELDRSKSFNLHDLTYFSKSVEQKTGREVDVISAREIKNGRLAAAIEREKVLVYER